MGQDSNTALVTPQEQAMGTWNLGDDIAHLKSEWSATVQSIRSNAVFQGGMMGTGGGMLLGAVIGVVAEMIAPNFGWLGGLAAGGVMGAGAGGIFNGIRGYILGGAEGRQIAADAAAAALVNGGYSKEQALALARELRLDSKHTREVGRILSPENDALTLLSMAGQHTDRWCNPDIPDLARQITRELKMDGAISPLTGHRLEELLAADRMHSEAGPSLYNAILTRLLKQENPLPDYAEARLAEIRAFPGEAQLPRLITEIGAEFPWVQQVQWSMPQSYLRERQNAVILAAEGVLEPLRQGQAPGEDALQALRQEIREDRSWGGARTLTPFLTNALSLAADLSDGRLPGIREELNPELKPAWLKGLSQAELLKEAEAEITHRLTTRNSYAVPGSITLALEAVRGELANGGVAVTSGRQLQAAVIDQRMDGPPDMQSHLAQVLTALYENINGVDKALMSGAPHPELSRRAEERERITALGSSEAAPGTSSLGQANREVAAQQQNILRRG
jgi:hypothetical protein